MKNKDKFSIGDSVTASDGLENIVSKGFIIEIGYYREHTDYVIKDIKDTIRTSYNVPIKNIKHSRTVLTEKTIKYYGR